MSMSKESQKYEVCFVQNSASTEEASNSLKCAFEAMDSNQMDPMWVQEEDCLKISKKESKLYVMDPFEGKAFEHLKNINCRIVGPLCILYCLENGDILPKRPHPVYSVSMRKITVSCSNIDNACREDIRKKVELMGGLFSKDFTKSVSHLVVGEVGSKKYQVAANFRLPIMTPSWVEEVWKSGQHKQLHASDSSFDFHKCPIFKGLVITVSQLSVGERSEVQAIIKENGGTYLAPLKARETTHLVLTEPTGDKYRYAKNWKIFCVNTSWIFDSVEAGYCKDENLYKIENTSKLTQPKRSTPNRDLTSIDLPLVDCSAITNTSFVTHLDETMKSDISLPVTRKSGQFAALEEFDLSSLPKYGQFLDGCKIFLSGFSSNHLGKLIKIVNSGGGMRFSKYSESISHVVCGDLSADFLQILKSSSVKPYVVNLNWLLECCKKESLVDEKPFLCMDATLLSPEKNEPEVKSVSASQTSVKSLPRNDDTTQDNINDIFKQYVCDNQNASGSKVSNDASESMKVKKESTSNINSHNRQQGSLVEQEIEVVDLEDEGPTDTQLLFSGLKFTIVGFGEKDTDILAKMIETHSGAVLNNDSSFTADIAIVPILKHDYTICASHIVTNCWLQKCIEDSRMFEFDENELFNPVEIPIGAKPFESFVISVSQYSGTERDCLMHLAEVLGATCQEYFVRKANKSRGILSNTHLVVATPDGSKYEASKKWKIPAVTKQWVLDAAKSGVTPPVDKYLVEACIPMQVTEDAPFIPALKENTMEKENINQDNVEDVFVEPAIPSRRSSIKVCIENGLDENKSTNSLIPSVNINNLPTEFKQGSFKEPSHSSTPQRHLDKICNTKNVEHLLSPMISKQELSLNESLSLEISAYKCQFQVSGLLKDLDSSVSQDQSLSTSMRRQSLPLDELFSKHLASGLRKVNRKVFSQSDTEPDVSRNSFHEAPCPQPVADKRILNGVILCVSKKLLKLQAELIEIVASLGGDYLWSYDNTCTHFVFTGKLNDLAKEFREARSQGKKIVCPDWVYACKEMQALVDEDLYPHTLKKSMSLASEIAIVKNSVPSETDQQSVENKKDSKSCDATPLGKDGVDFNQQLNDLLVAAKSAKRRQSKRILNSVSSSPSTEVSPIHMLHKKISESSFIKPAELEEKEGEDTQDTCSQQSQSCPVVWDDPTGRMEREKIAALAAIQVNNVEENLPSTSEEADPRLERTHLSSFTCNGNVDEVFMPPRKKSIDLPKTKKFMFTNISESKKLEYIKIIKDLGGEVSDEKAFDLTATHLVAEKPIKNEKLLSSVASGKWIVHPQYIITSQEQRKFVSEEDFEWGGPSTEEFLQNLSMGNRKIACCPFRWRIKLNGCKDLTGAFHGWKVTVIADDKAKQSTYVKILEAGGAEVLPSDASSSNLEELSHAIVDMKKRTLSQMDLSPYVSLNIKCIKPEYLAFFLIEDPPPDVDNFIIPEAKELIGGSEQSSKRRNLSIATRGSKRARLT